MSKGSSSLVRRSLLVHMVVEVGVEDIVEGEAREVAVDTLEEDRARVEVDTLEDHHVMVLLAEDTAEAQVQDDLEDIVEARVVSHLEGEAREVAVDTLEEDRARVEVDTLEDHHVMVLLAEDTAEAQVQDDLEDIVEARVVDQGEATRKMLHHEPQVGDIAIIEIVIVDHHPQVNNKKRGICLFF